MSRCSSARGPDPWYNPGGPSKVGASKSFLFAEGSLVVETSNDGIAGNGSFKWFYGCCMVFSFHN